MPTVIPDKIPCESPQQLEQELATLQDALSLKESEETWDRIANALTRFGAVVKGGGYKYEKELLNGIKASTRQIVSAMNSDRTRLSAAALDCIIIIAPRIGPAFESLVPLFVPCILRLATRTNKVYVTRSQEGLTLILGYCQIPSILPCLLAACKESKIVTGRVVAVEGVLRCLKKWDWTQKEIMAKVGDVEEVIKITGRDKDAGIRQTSRKIFEAYKVLFPQRVEEFTLPLTPVTKKYLGIKPQPVAEKSSAQPHSPSARDKTKRPLKKPDLSSSLSAVPLSTSASGRSATGRHARSASTNTVINGLPGPTANARSGAAPGSHAMPPPATIPSRPHNPTHPEASHPQTEPHDGQERQRTLSTTSSTFSIKSAPSNPQSYEHRPPVRLALSQSHSAAASSAAVVASGGQARRVRRIVNVEPHPANRPDPTTHKTPVRLLGGSTPRITPRPNGKPGQDSVGAMSKTNTTGIAFPTFDVGVTERKGAQRVLKAAVAPNTDPVPKKADDPKAVTGDGSKRETKPSIFRRGAPESVSADDPKAATGDGSKRETKLSIFRRGAPEGVSAPLTEKQQEAGEKPKEGFVPRRGGVLQPTLSQLSKQKAPTGGAAGSMTGKGANTVVMPKRAVRGIGVKAVSSRGLPAARGRGRGGVGVSRMRPAGRRGDQMKVSMVDPAMVPLPLSPGRDGNDATRVASLSSSKMSRTGDGQAPAETSVEEATMPESQESVETVTAETNSKEGQTGGAKVLVKGCHDGVLRDVFTAEDIVQTRTPPFPPASEETDEDELEAIEFTRGDAYDPAGVPIKTPRKVMGVAGPGLALERNPLSDVVLNE